LLLEVVAVTLQHAVKGALKGKTGHFYTAQANQSNRQTAGTFWYIQ